MKVCLLVVVLALACSLAIPSSARAQPQLCDWSPSSQCRAPGILAGAPSYPCYPGQIKGDRDSLSYHLPSQASYPAVGAGPGADVWCFDSEAEAQSLGFQRAG